MNILVRASLIFCFCVLGGIFAVDVTHAFSLSPLRHTMVVDPGKTAVAQVEIFNNENYSIELVPEIDAFSIHPDTGHAQFGEGDIAKSWIHTNVSTLSLSPQEKKIVNFTVTVPPGSSSQSHYLALFLKQKALDGQIGIGKRIGTLLFLHVSGPVQEKMQLQNFSSIKDNGKKMLHIQTVNEGSIHLIPKGTIDFFNIFGKKIGSVQINPEERKVLPEGIWRTSLDVPQFGVGRIRADLHLIYGQTEQTLFGTISFWNISSVLVIGLSGILLLCGGIFFAKRYKKV